MNRPKQKPLAADTAKGRIKGGKPSMYMRFFPSMADVAAQGPATGTEGERA